MSPRTGRPTDCPKDTQITIRIDAPTLKVLDVYCREKKITRVEGIRQAIRLLPDQKK